jgi:predicted short-subunit dehydrogenase-like oxidoreductase (DUF2520 family)
MIKVVLIGQGNVTSHLANGFTNVTNVAVFEVNSRQLKDIPDADVIIISVSDDAIATVANQLKNSNSLIVHTSGTVSMETINSKRKGVFYPLQSFTKNKPVDFSTIPFCLETVIPEDLILLENLVQSLQAKAYKINSEQRKKLHLAAVFVNNFTNHMYQIGQEICLENQVPFEVLFPLIEETAKKINSVNPKDAQTGPAKRNDQQTIKNHLEQLNLQQQEIYKLITKSIQND